MIEFRFYLHEDTYVVWLAGINRYLQLKEPAFRVFKLWANGQDKTSIQKACSEQYSLPESESKRFVGEIIEQVQQLNSTVIDKSGSDTESNPIPIEPEYYSEKTYRIGNYSFSFLYRSKYLADLFHPLFRHHEIKKNLPASIRFELFNTGCHDGFKINGTSARFFPVEEIDAFQGAVYLEILNVLHNMHISDWMGVLHASAITDGDHALIFTAPSGSGKTTIALLLQAHGYEILSDDFVPIAMKEPEIYPFPAQISVKPGSILDEYFSGLTSISFPQTSENVIFVSPGDMSGLLKSMPAKAIVFVKYDPGTEFELRRESNLGMMNDLITQSWIANTPEAAERFFRWYFGLQVYTLRYSNNEKAVEGIRMLFK